MPWTENHYGETIDYKNTHIHTIAMTTLSLLQPIKLFLFFLMYLIMPQQQQAAGSNTLCTATALCTLALLQLILPLENDATMYQLVDYCNINIQIITVTYD
jgi:hypothetical protein